MTMNFALFFAAVYGTLVGGNLVHAPYIVKSDGANRVTATLTEPQANALGFKLVIDQPPSCASNEYAVATGYALEGQRIVRIYEKHVTPPVVRRWTPLSIKRAAVALGRWADVKAFLQSADAYDDFVMAQYEAEDDPQFVALMSALRNRFGDEWVDAILNSAEVEP